MDVWFLKILLNVHKFGILFYITTKLIIIIIITIIIANVLFHILYFSVYVVVQFYSWFKFCFPLFQTHYHTLSYPNTKKNKIQTKDKIEPQHIFYSLQSGLQ